MQNGWLGTLKYAVDCFGIVHLKGSLNGTSAVNMVLADLLAIGIPDVTLFAWNDSDGATTKISLYSNRYLQLAVGKWYAVNLTYTTA